MKNVVLSFHHYFLLYVYSTHWIVNQCCFNVGLTSLMMAQLQPNIGSLSLVLPYTSTMSTSGIGRSGHGVTPMSRDRPWHQITQYIGPMLAQCRATVCDADQPSQQRCFSVSCLLSKPNVVLMLGQRRRGCASITSTLSTFVW